eukprot:c27827_g1_i3 orf=289-1356(-)
MECGGSDVLSVGELHLLSLEVSGGGDGYGLGVEERNKIGRHPRWSRHETLILIEAKKVEEVKCLKVREERERGIEIGRNFNSDSKWLSISLFCERHAVMRSAAQCRKRWCNLSADYKRIRDWQSLRGKQSFWLMSNDIRKEYKLPGCFDREVFDSLDKCLGKNPCIAAEIIFDSGRPGADDGLYSDIEHPLRDEELAGSPDKEMIGSPIVMESPPMESSMPTPGSYFAASEGCPSQWPFATGTGEDKFSDEKFTLGACEEKPNVHPSARKKRKRPPSVGESEDFKKHPSSIGENDDFNNQLFTMLENNSRVLTAHVESQNINSQLDRNQRKEHAESMVSVLGKLADALAKIAERL